MRKANQLITPDEMVKSIFKLANKNAKKYGVSREKLLAALACWLSKVLFQGKK
jgi:hypothetical protein